MAIKNPCPQPPPHFLFLAFRNAKSHVNDEGNEKGQVSIEASAESMDDLHELLKLAGVEMSVDLGKAEKPEDSDDNDHDEPESHDNKEEPKDKKVMVISPNDASYSTDKEVLVNFLKDKLKKSIT